MFVSILGFFLYGMVSAPSKLNQVEFVVVEKSGSWKEEISKYVLSYVRLGQDLTPEFVSALKSEIESLPWVNRCELSVKGGTLTVKIWEARPEFILLFGKKSYLIGENGFVLKEGSTIPSGYPIFFYRGKSSPFTVVNGFLKIKKSVKMELRLIKSKLNEIKLKGRKPEISLLDCGVQLAFKRPPVLVYLGIGEINSWRRFEELSQKDFLKPGVYDFRFEQMLIVEGRQGKCSAKKSLH